MSKRLRNRISKEFFRRVMDAPNGASFVFYLQWIKKEGEVCKVDEFEVSDEKWVRRLWERYRSVAHDMGLHRMIVYCNDEKVFGLTFEY